MKTLNNYLNEALIKKVTKLNKINEDSIYAPLNFDNNFDKWMIIIDILKYNEKSHTFSNIKLRSADYEGYIKYIKRDYDLSELNNNYTRLWWRYPSWSTVHDTAAFFSKKMFEENRRCKSFFMIRNDHSMGDANGSWPSIELLFNTQEAQLEVLNNQNDYKQEIIDLFNKYYSYDVLVKNLKDKWYAKDYV